MAHAPGVATASGRPTIASAPAISDAAASVSGMAHAPGAATASGRPTIANAPTISAAAATGAPAASTGAGVFAAIDGAAADRPEYRRNDDEIEKSRHVRGRSIRRATSRPKAGAEWQRDILRNLTAL